MKNRSYIRIAKQKREDVTHVSNFTTVKTASKTPRARRRRMKDKKKLSNINNKYNAASTTTSPIKFDEPSIPKASSLSAHSTPFKPRRILQRPKAKKSPVPIAMSMHNQFKHRNGLNPTTQKRVPFHNPIQPVSAVQSEKHGIVRFNPEYINNSMEASPILTKIGTMNIKGTNKKKQIIGKPPGLKSISVKNTMNKIECNDITDTDNDEDERKSIGFLKMLDSIDTDDIFNDIVKHKRNYDFPKNVSGIFESDIWHLSTDDDDDSNWDVFTSKYIN